MSNINISIQNVKNQIKTIEYQLDNIITIQNMNGSNNFGNQLQNMGIQMMNIGIQMINDGMQMSNMAMDTSYLMQQMMNIEKQIQNIGMKLKNGFGMNMNNNMGINMNNNMGMNMNNMNNMIGINMNNNKGILANNNLGMNMNNNIGINIDNKKEMIVHFKLMTGERKTLIVQYGTSVGDLLKKFFQAIGKPEALKKKDSIIFIHNSQKLSYEDKTKIEEKFYIKYPIIILVNDLNALIGG